MRSMANMTIVVPADGPETAKATHAIAQTLGPVYMRLGRDLEVSVCDFDYEFRIGEAVLMREGQGRRIDRLRIGCSHRVGGRGDPVCRRGVGPGHQHAYRQTD